MIYALMLALIIVLMIITVSYVKRQNKRREKLAEIREWWGKPNPGNRNFKLIAAYLNKIPTPSRLSAGTVVDLDLDHVFEFIDRTNSKPGQQYLYSRLHNRTAAVHQAMDVDEQVENLPADKVILETYQLKLAELDNTSAYYLPELFDEQTPLFDALTTFYIRVSGLVVIALIVLTAATHNQIYFLSLMGMVIANLVLHYATKKKVMPYTHSLPQLIKLIDVAKWFGKRNGKLTSTLTKQAISNVAKLNKSLRYVSLSEAANDPTDLSFALFELIKILLLLEPLMFITSINQVNKYRADIRRLFEHVAHIDLLISVRAVREGLPFYCKPEFTNDDSIQVNELYHPLVAGCIPNNMHTTADHGVLITGSNMSGKTTFIRSIAINALLAQTIFTSCSKSYRAPWLNIHTSIRISDDVEEHKSYFQAEALSVLEILKQCDADRPAKSLVIIDEIFRGTNTIERIAAAKAVLAYLTTNGHFVFVSTHDLELAELLGSDYSVYSFEEKVTDGARLVFDYRIKPGLLKNKNGIAILQAMGYPQTVVNDAGSVSEQLRYKYQL